MMFLFLLLQVVILACLSVSRYKSFAAVVMWVAFAMHRRVFPSTCERDAHVVLPKGNVSSISSERKYVTVWWGVLCGSKKYLACQLPRCYL
ncbi:hypothetical protein [Anaplasma phagocytophilum]|uniref:hypothetical protein n=1 Tax=Anaplasma phagocytophilum TaxID=948 RepID=UPI0018B0C0F1|nr:hypothetical protein [Anaplasma phagocytophilum]